MITTNYSCRNWELLLFGVGTFKACEIVGIGRKTGYRWRAENGGLPPAWLSETARSGAGEFEPVRVVITHPAGEQQASLKSDHPQ